jgi:hypothetical protein
MLHCLQLCERPSGGDARESGCERQALGHLPTLECDGERLVQTTGQAQPEDLPSGQRDAQERELGRL